MLFSGLRSITVLFEDLADGFHLLFAHGDEGNGLVQMSLGLLLLALVYKANENVVDMVLLEFHEHISV